MTNFRSLSDKAAVTLSMLCTIHCLLLPFFLAWLPTAVALTVESESFHLVMILLVLPLSLFALFVGCKAHKRYRVLVLGFIGLFLLLLAIFLGHDVLGEMGEKILTVIGSLFIVVGHLQNYHLCRHNACCDCGQ
jgi:carbon starvation protein CstA